MNKIIWVFVALIGAVCFGYLALQNGETVSAMYLVVAAVCIYAIGYRFYGRFIAYTVLDLSLQQDFSDLAVFVQQDFPLAHFFFFLPLPPSAKEAPVKSKAAVANNNTFFIVIILCD